jgi:hypothetical protein
MLNYRVSFYGIWRLNGVIGKSSRPRSEEQKVMFHENLSKRKEMRGKGKN